MGDEDLVRDGSRARRWHRRHYLEPETWEEREARLDLKRVDEMSDDELVSIIEGYRAGLSGASVARATRLPYGRVLATYRILRARQR